MFFKRVGDFFTKTIPKTVTKDIPRIVTKDIPRVVTKDIPRVVTKDIPRIVTKDIPRVVTKDIPNAFASVGKRETYAPELVALRKKVDGAETRLGERRETFLRLKAEYAEQRKLYQRLSEDYAKRNSDGAAGLEVAYIPDREWDDPGGAGQAPLKHVENTVRHIVGFVTLGLGEAAWAAPESAQERDFLNKRLATLQGVNMKLGRAIDELTRANREMQRACDEIRQAMGGADAEQVGERINAQALAEGVDAGRREIAQGMLRAGASIEQVALVTELDPTVLNELAAAAAPADRTEVIALSPEEQADNARELLDEGVETAQIARLTGLSEAQVKALGSV